jgi:hypothetical protein
MPPGSKAGAMEGSVSDTAAMVPGMVIEREIMVAARDGKAEHPRTARSRIFVDRLRPSHPVLPLISKE